MMGALLDDDDDDDELSFGTVFVYKVVVPYSWECIDVTHTCLFRKNADISAKIKKIYTTSRKLHFLRGSIFEGIGCRLLLGNRQTNSRLISTHTYVCINSYK